MEKFVPYEKLSKKEKRRRDALGRTTWGPLKPTTRKPEPSRAYNRKKAQSWKKDVPGSVLFFVYRGVYCKIQLAQWSAYSK